jgi:hypothetical protein
MKKKNFDLKYRATVPLKVDGKTPGNARIYHLERPSRQYMTPKGGMHVEKRPNNCGYPPGAFSSASPDVFIVYMKTTMPRVQET